MLVLGALLSAVIGLSLGLIGGGGSIVTLPVLVYVLGIDPHAAIPLSLVVVGVTSLAGAVVRLGRGEVDPRAAGLFAATGAVGALAGARLTPLVPPAALMLLFAALMLAAAVGMGGGRDADESGGRSTASPGRAVLAGLGVGVMTGFLGVGGGFLILPALVLFGGLPMRRAVGTSLLVIAANSLAGLLGHLTRVPFDVSTAVLVTVPALAGMALGTRLSRATSPRMLRRVFSVTTVVIAVYLAVRNLGVLWTPS